MNEQAQRYREQIEAQERARKQAEQVIVSLSRRLEPRNETGGKEKRLEGVSLSSFIPSLVSVALVKRNTGGSADEKAKSKDNAENDEQRRAEIQQRY